MIYNKTYMRFMAIGLLALIVIDSLLSLYAFKNNNEVLMYIVTITTVIIGLVIVIFFIVNGLQKDHFLYRKAVKEQETYLLNEDALLHKVSEVIELNNNYHIEHSVLGVHVRFNNNDKALYTIVDTIEHLIRKNDILFRRDNGHFAIVAYSNMDDAIGLAKKLIEKIEKACKDQEIDAITNVGVTQIKSNDNKNDAVTRCERALNASIKYGNNHVEYMR